MRVASGLTALFCGFLCTSVQAHEFRIGDILIDRPWSRAMPPVATTGATYFHIVNTSAAPDRLLSTASPVAERVELHMHEHVDGVMKMRHVDAVDLPAHGEAVFEPGGLHVMLIGLRQPLVEGEHFPLTLGFERAGEVTVEVQVQSASHGGHSH